jgi:hypothetical protein
MWGALYLEGATEEEVVDINITLGNLLGFPVPENRNEFPIHCMLLVEWSDSPVRTAKAVADLLRLAAAESDVAA